MAPATRRAPVGRAPPVPGCSRCTRRARAERAPVPCPLLSLAGRRVSTDVPGEREQAGGELRAAGEVEMHVAGERPPDAVALAAARGASRVTHLVGGRERGWRWGLE